MNNDAYFKDPFLNKGTAFTQREREKLGLVGLLPPVVHSLNEQVEIEYIKICKFHDQYSKSQYLLNLYNINRTLYFAVTQKYVEELLPIIYTPTIADSVVHFSETYLWNNNAAYLDVNRPEEIESALVNATKYMEHVDLMVITDGEGVLGIGDWGINGVMISIGKLNVYTIAAGIDPKRVLPIIIDNGTNRKELLKSPLYLGNRQKRKNGEEYLGYIDKLVGISSRLFPEVLFHWEDFGRENAKVILDRYRDKISTFNDDIQGTGIMMVSAVNAAMKVTNTNFHNHRFVIFGAGTAGVGIAEQIKLEMIMNGFNQEEARKRIFLVDRNGLICQNDSSLTDGQKEFARSIEEFPRPLSTLQEVIDIIRPSYLIGTSGQTNAFDEKIVKKMAEINDRPAIFPLSNPSSLSEANADNIIEWTNGKGLVVTGSPSEPVIYNGIEYKIGQANNALLYPGLGLGIVASKASNVTDRMLSEAAHAISKVQKLDQIGCSLLPDVSLLRECSINIAKAVFLAAVEEKVSPFEISDIEEQIYSSIWECKY